MFHPYFTYGLVDLDADRLRSGRLPAEFLCDEIDLPHQTVDSGLRRAMLGRPLVSERRGPSSGRNRAGPPASTGLRGDWT